MNSAARQLRRPHRGFDSLEQEVFLNLWRTYDRLRVLEEELFGRFGLTAQQFNVLRLLAGAHPESLPTLELAGRLVSRAPDITRMIDKLVALGLVARTRPQDDRRLVHVAITESGLRRLEEIRGPLSECHRAQLGHLSRHDLDELIRLLEAARAPHEPERSRWRPEAKPDGV